MDAEFGGCSNVGVGVAWGPTTAAGAFEAYLHAIGIDMRQSPFLHDAAATPTDKHARILSYAALQTLTLFSYIFFMNSSPLQSSPLSFSPSRPHTCAFSG